MIIRASLCLVALLLAVGCQGRTNTYNIAVHNASDEPIMVGLAKEGPPFEDHWATPEQVSRIEFRDDVHGWGMPVSPGKTATVSSEKATLNAGFNAFVRVYATAPTLPGILAISEGSPNRLDIRLVPGNNDIVVTRSDGRLTYERAGGAQAGR
jgi:hypothetical protein